MSTDTSTIKDTSARREEALLKHGTVARLMYEVSWAYVRSYSVLLAAMDEAEHAQTQHEIAALEARVAAHRAPKEPLPTISACPDYRSFELLERLSEPPKKPESGRRMTLQAVTGMHAAIAQRQATAPPVELVGGS